MTENGMNEPPFVRAMREEIRKVTGTDIPATDSIYPILVCIQIVCRALFAEVRKKDVKEWQNVASGIEESLANFDSGMEKRLADFTDTVSAIINEKTLKNRKREIAQRCAIAGLVGVMIGICVGLAFARMI